MTVSKLKIAAAAAVVACLFGCAASGVKVTDEQIAHFKEGVTTEKDVIASLGAPTMRSRLPDGSVMMMYMYSEYSTRASTFIPIVGAFVGGADYKSNSVTMTFGQDGKLKSTSSSQTSSGTASGAASGLTSPVDTQQPRRPSEQ